MARPPSTPRTSPAAAPRRRLGLVAAALGAVIIAGVSILIWQRSGSAPSSTGGPIILISIDTLRADRLPAYGYAGTRTPNIDRLAAGGVVFENAYSHSPQTLPAHASILSGRLPFEHGVRDNIGFTLKPDERFLQHTLKDLGYATGGFVSAYVLRQQTGINRGFDEYDDVLPAASPDAPLGQVQRAGADTVASAMRWIDRQTSTKFFLFVHIYEPHRPYAPPARFGGASAYDGEVSFADEIVGTLFEHLRRKDLYDRSSIVLLSDHGEGLGDHGEDEHGIFLYRETIQVPLIVKAPGARPGTRVAAAVQHLDVAPTLLALAGGRNPSALKGRSLLPVLRGTGALTEASIYSESLSPRYHFGWSELYALSDDRYRLIRAPRDELYDIAQDPRETRSIAAERTQAHAAMRQALDAMIAGTPMAAPSAVSDEDRRKLAALGYVGTQSTAPAAARDGLPDPKDKVGALRQYKLATELAGQGRLEEAADAYRTLLGGEPGMTDVWLQLAGIYEQRGMFAEAVAAHKEIIRRKPKDPAALTGAAGGLLRLGRLDEARAHAELAVDVAPAGAHQLLARAAIQANDAAAARTHARLAQQAEPTLPMIAVVDGLLEYRAGRFASALPHFLEARRAMDARTVQVPDVNYYLGDSLARLERYAEAEPYLASELRVFPSHTRARAGLAMLYRATGRVAESDQAVAELIRMSPTHEGYALAEQLWTMFGEPGRAAAMKARSRGTAR
ncbi:MAG: sulfatase-like hydrolase/transferase [Acidobacteriota bacterium]|nr:sulfatase-like hydrolase/transferase [Acidobacteriota bacterium]